MIILFSIGMGFAVSHSALYFSVAVADTVGTYRNYILEIKVFQMSSLFTKLINELFYLFLCNTNMLTVWIVYFNKFKESDFLLIY